MGGGGGGGGTGAPGGGGGGGAVPSPSTPVPPELPPIPPPVPPAPPLPPLRLLRYSEGLIKALGSAEENLGGMKGRTICLFTKCPTWLPVSWILFGPSTSVGPGQKSFLIRTITLILGEIKFLI